MLCVSNMFGVIVSAILLSALTDVQSQYVRHPEIHRSVLHKKVIATWDEAKRRCEAEGAAMASPLEEKMLEYMRSSIGINNHTTPYFIGFRATSNPELTFASLEGVLLDYLPEAAMNMIDQLDPQDGDCLAMDRHNIRVVSCRAQLPYICYKNDTFTSTSTTVTPVDVTTASTSEKTRETDANCSLGYTYLSGSYYKRHNESSYTTWDDAQQACSAEGGYLVVINDEDEARVVTQFAFGGNGGDSFWIGLRRGESGDWRSVLGDPVTQIYHNWANSRDYYNCGSLNSQGNIERVNCPWSYNYICEKQC